MPIKFTITEEELAQSLDISHQKLLDIIVFFDSDSEDEWELVKDKHYIIVNPSLKTKKFSYQGALKIAYYLDAHGNVGIVYRIKDFITRKSSKLKHSLAQKIIQEEFAEGQDRIIQVNSRNFIHKQCLRRILETNGQTVNKALDDLQKTSPLEIDHDYVQQPFSDPKKQKQGDQLWFSGKGCFLVSRQISQNLKDKARRSKCHTISVEIEKALKVFDDKAQNESKKIDSAKNKAKRRDKICQITLVERDSINKMTLTAHHLYSVNKYPHLAAVQENLITINSLIHQEFHSWMGGFDKPCTVEDFINFLIDRYPDQASETLLQRLYEVRKILNVDSPKK